MISSLLDARPIAATLATAVSFVMTCGMTFGAARPVAHFGFDEIDKNNLVTAVNSVGLDGVYHGSTEDYYGINDIPVGVFGRAVALGPSSAHVLLPQSGIGGEIDSLNSFSIAAWIGDGQSAVLGQFGDSWQGIRLLTRNFGVPGDIDSLSLNVGFGTGALVAYFDYIPVLDRNPGFQHIAITYDPNYARLYLNAQLVVEFEVIYSIEPSGQDYFIGGARDVQSGGIGQLQLDELWVFDGALSQTQIRQLYRTNIFVPEPSTFALLQVLAMVGILMRVRGQTRSYLSPEMYAHGSSRPTHGGAST
jgi:hypothetical protein